MICDSIAQLLCTFHPHNNMPCNGDCGDKYLQLTVKDWKADVLKAEGRIESLRGGIMLSGDDQDQIAAIFGARKGKEGEER